MLIIAQELLTYYSTINAIQFASLQKEKKTKGDGFDCFIKSNNYR